MSVGDSTKGMTLGPYLVGEMMAFHKTSCFKAYRYNSAHFRSSEE